MVLILIFLATNRADWINSWDAPTKALFNIQRGSRHLPSEDPNFVRHLCLPHKVPYPPIPSWLRTRLTRAQSIVSRFHTQLIRRPNREKTIALRIPSHKIFTLPSR